MNSVSKKDATLGQKRSITFTEAQETWLLENADIVPYCGPGHVSWNKVARVAMDAFIDHLKRKHGREDDPPPPPTPPPNDSV